jgi:hypothetical protein
VKFSPNCPISVREPAEVRVAVAVGLALVHEHGAVLAAVADDVGLRVAVDVEAPASRRPATGAFHIAERTSRPRPVIVRGRPTLAETSRIGMTRWSFHGGRRYAGL